MVALPRFSSARPAPLALLGVLALMLAGALAFGTAAQAAQTGGNVPLDAAMLRTPDVSADKIVFRYDNDLWIAPKSGGTALPLSSPAGAEQFPRFSPDGSKVAFGANYDGNGDIYEVPVAGGLPRRLSFQPGGVFMVDYAPDGRVVFGSSIENSGHQNHLYYSNPNGGLPEALPPFEAMFASFSADGQWVALDQQWIEFQNWNRYQGGTASNIWLYNLKNGESRQITDWPGTDTAPMFHGNDKVYFLSDAGPEHRRNIWVYTLADGERRQVTFFKDFETKWPAIGPKDIVMENGGQLWLLDIASEKLSKVEISVPGDRMSVMPQTIDAGQTILEGGISPQAKRVAVNARGDIWTVPAEKGYPRNLTGTNGITEREPTWSPDGQWIAYLSNASGEYEIYVRPSDGSGEARQLTKDGHTFRMNLHWSPDSKKIAFTDKTGAFFVHTVDSGETVQFAKDPWGNPGGISWAKDSVWIAFNLADAASSNGTVMLYNSATKESHRVTQPYFNCGNAAFDLSGDYLFYTSDSSFNPNYSPVGDWGEFNFSDTTTLCVTTLRADIVSPFAPKNDDEEIKPAEEKPAEGEKPADAPAADAAAPAAGDAAAPAAPAEGEKKEEPKAEPLKIDLEGLDTRSITLPSGNGGYFGLQGGDKKVYYMKMGAGGPPSLCMFDLSGDKPAETPLLPGVGGFQLTPDASRMLVFANGGLFITGAMPGAALDKPVNTNGLLVQVNPREEWKAIVYDAWSRYRDYFYDPDMHGVDWDSVGKRALGLVDYATNRGDVEYIVRQMVAELNSGHTYVYSDNGDYPRSIGIGQLACDFEYASDSAGQRGVCFKKIYSGASWENDLRGPLQQPGVNVKEGDFLLAVNGEALGENGNPWALLSGTVGKPTELTVNSVASRDGKERKILVSPLPDDGELRLRDWIESNRQYVYEKTGGKIGYIYVRDTGWGGASDFYRQFVGQHNMQGLIIDERWNGGGLSPDTMIQILNRRARQYWATRDGVNWRSPWFMNGGPKVMLINENAGSGGDSFPYLFRDYKLGKLIGKRTWGGLIGISGNPPLLDGSGVSVPNFGFFEVDGTWGVEGHGVDPDIEVDNTPSILARGEDAQLDRGIQEVLKELGERPWNEPAKPKYPNRSGAGIRDEDK
ncbi:PDZ domain-containing protein [bacterium]|nr:PDZ domain-containing protein [bacterium]